MAETTAKRAGELVRKVFEILIRHGDGLPAREVLRAMEKELSLTEYEKGYYPTRPDVRRFEKIVRFCTISSVKAGWLTKNKGIWAVTDEGKRAYEHYDDPTQFITEARRLYRSWRRGQAVEEDDDGATAGRIAAIEEAEEAAWSEIQMYLAEMNPYDFQELIAGLLQGMGYHISWVAPAGPDRGIDILAHSDPLGVQGGRIKVQVKRRADKIPVGEVRSFMAVLGDNDVGIFVTTSGFTAEAETEARAQEKRRLMLLDAKKLFDLWVENYESIPEVRRSILPLRKVYYLAPEE
jgi:restriction system protein